MSKRGVAGGLQIKPTQRQEVLSYMQDFGSISSFEAYIELGITQLGARIFELKGLGYNIRTIKRKRINKRGKIISYVDYYLADGAKEVVGK